MVCHKHMNYKMYKGAIFVAILLGSVFVFGYSALATSVSRMFLTNLEGYPGKTIKTELTLEGTEPGERSGYWYTHYKKIEGDTDKMDITSWITVEPKDYTIKEKEAKVFTIEVKIPKNTKPGLWGATTPEAGNVGHSDERRTYIVFKDALGGGNVYSGLLIPISVKVMPNPNPFARVISFAEQNIVVIVLSAVILTLLALLLLKKRKKTI